MFGSDISIVVLGFITVKTVRGTRIAFRIPCDDSHKKNCIASAIAEGLAHRSVQMLNYTQGDKLNMVEQAEEME